MNSAPGSSRLRSWDGAGPSAPETLARLLELAQPALALILGLGTLAQLLGFKHGDTFAQGFDRLGFAEALGIERRRGFRAFLLRGCVHGEDTPSQKKQQVRDCWGAQARFKAVPTACAVARTTGITR